MAFVCADKAVNPIIFPNPVGSIPYSAGSTADIKIAVANSVAKAVAMMRDFSDGTGGLMSFMSLCVN